MAAGVKWRLCCGPRQVAGAEAIPQATNAIGMRDFDRDKGKSNVAQATKRRMFYETIVCNPRMSACLVELIAKRAMCRSECGMQAIAP